MSTMKIVATTDGRFTGHEFDSEDNPIHLTEDILISVEKVIDLTGGKRFSNSNYVIDAVEV